MATIKVKFRASTVLTNEGALFYQVIHNRVARQVHTGFKVYPAEWDKTDSKIVISSDINNSRKNYLSRVDESIANNLWRLNCIVKRLERTEKVYTADMVVELFNSSDRNDEFISFAWNLIHRLRQIGKVNTAERYSIAINNFMRFLKRKDLDFEAMDSDLMMGYEIYLKGTGVCQNTSSFYMRNLRAIYNRAVEKELVMQHYPFKHVYTGIDKTVKRAVSLKVIRQIRDLDLTSNSTMDYARDIFMFSFYTRGMSFIDMAFLKKNDLRNGVLSYRRKKTNQKLFIKWEKSMQDIVDKYDTSDSLYLLPIIKNIGKDERIQYKSNAHLVNNKLRMIGAQLGLSIPLTTYVARHGWASIAKSKNISISTISEAMGHDSENTTRIYLASLDTSLVDKANSLILNSL